MKIGLLVATLLFASPGMFAGEVVVSGYAGGNMSDIIRVYSFTDPFSGREKELQTLFPAADGKFRILLDNEGVGEYFIRNGAHDNHFFIDGSTNIDLVLAPYKRLTGAEIQNPFFEYVTIHAASRADDDLNNMIRRFENLYLEAAGRISSIIESGARPGEKDSIIESLGETADRGKHYFFDTWVIYRTAGLKLSGINDPGRRDDILLQVEELFDPASRSCTGFIENHYSHFMRELASGREGDIVRRTLEAGNTARPLVDFASSSTGINYRPLAEYIIIMNLYLEFYSNYFNSKDIFPLIIWFSTSAESGSCRDLSQIISERLGRFLPGAPVPDFSLTNPAGDISTPASWKGKFLLLSFARSDSYTTLSEYNLLVRWKEQYGEYLEIITILCDDDFTSGSAKMSANGYKWLMLDGSGNEKLTSLYEVRFFPTFFLADPAGKFIRAPAPFPSENLMQVFQEKLQPYLLDNIRNR